MSEFQSNPTSNVNPLARYGYPQVFTTMSPQTPQASRSLWLFLEGGSKPYLIENISISTKVDTLKAAIQHRVKALQDVDADDLKLLKVVSLIPRACAF